MINNVEPISSTDFNKGLVTRSDFFKGDINASPDTMDVQWRFDASLHKRFGCSSTNSVSLGRTTTAGWLTNSTGTLSNTISSYRKLDEDSDTRIDQFGQANLMSVNSTGSVVGIRNQASAYVPANSQALVTQNTSSLFGSGNFSIATWVYFNELSITREQPIVSKKPVSIDSATTLLLHFDGNGGPVSFPDSGVNNFTVTSAGSVQISSVQSQFGGASCVFNGSADFLTLPDSSAWQLDSGTATNDWTIDFWVRFNEFPPEETKMALILQRNTSASNWSLHYGANNTLQFTINDSIVLESLGSFFTSQTWQHVALVNSSGTLMAFRDGTQMITAPASAFPAVSAVLNIGSGNAFEPYSFNGNIDELRISKGIARWVSSFTPPSLPYGSRDYEYYLYLNTDNLITFRVSSSGILQDGSVTASSIGAIATTSWYRIVAWHSANSHIGLDVNLSINTASYTSGIKNGSGTFSLGAVSNNLTDITSGRIDETGFWGRVLTVGERSQIWAGGSGNTYSSGQSGFSWAS